jgi:uncharacterized cupredoxin-like copper-binding protein
MSRLLAALLVCAFALAACGEDRGSVNVEGSGTGASTGGSTTGGSTTGTSTTSTTGGTEAPAEADQTLTVTADPGGALKWTEETLSADAGTVKFVLENPSTLPHALEIEGNGVEEETPTIEKDGTAELTVDLKAGEYEYYCPVSGHQEAGMTGTLTVE